MLSLLEQHKVEHLQLGFATSGEEYLNDATAPLIASGQQVTFGFDTTDFELDNRNYLAKKIISYTNKISAAGVLMTSNNVWYDGPSINILIPGTYFISGVMLIKSNTTCFHAAKIYSGSTVYTVSESSVIVSGSISLSNHSLSFLTTVTGPTTFTMAAISNISGSYILPESIHWDTNSDNGTYLYALRIA